MLSKSMQLRHCCIMGFVPPCSAAAEELSHAVSGAAAHLPHFLNAPPCFRPDFMEALPKKAAIAVVGEVGAAGRSSGTNTRLCFSEVVLAGGRAR